MDEVDKAEVREIVAKLPPDLKVVAELIMADVKAGAIMARLGICESTLQRRRTLIGIALEAGGFARPGKTLAHCFAMVNKRAFHNPILKRRAPFVKPPRHRLLPPA